VPHSITIELNPDHVDLKKLKEEVQPITEDLQRLLVERTLHETRGNIAKSARELGISRPKLYDLISRYGLNRDWRDGLMPP
jgi:two-component system, NtrC family, response regulator